ncbi:hypothetical protein BJX96DRAFT_180631 [Aspergillus floccosus]
MRSSCAKKATGRPKGSKKARSEPSRKQPPRGEASAPPVAPFVPDMDIRDASFNHPPSQASPSQASTTQASTKKTTSSTSHRSVRVVDRLNAINPPNLTDDDDLPQPKQPRNTACLNIYQDNATSNSSILSDVPSDAWEPSSILQDRDTNSSIRTGKGKRKRGDLKSLPQQKKTRQSKPSALEARPLLSRRRNNTRNALSQPAHE